MGGWAFLGGGGGGGGGRDMLDYVCNVVNVRCLIM